MKSCRNKKKIVSFLIVSFLVILGAFNLPFVYAIHMEGDGATFYPDDDHPVQFGVFIPNPNMYSTMYIDASNQGRFAMVNFQGVEDDYELIDFPGEDISELYPYYFDDYYKDTATNNNFTDPWLIDWINVTTLNPHDITLSNYSINSVFNYYVLIEGGDLTVPLNHSIPIQIDVMIESIGPKILKINWLTDDSSNIINENIKLISPSGKIIDPDEETVTSHAVQPPIELFDYLTFVAHETGAYRLLVYAEHNAGKPAYLNLEFLSSSIYSLPLETLKFVGNAEDILTIEEKEYSTWQSNWFRINGEKGDILRLQLNKDYTTEVMGVPIEPIISIWSPCENGYIRDSSIAEGIHEIYFPTSGNAYVSIIDADYGNWYRYSLFAKKLESIDYNIGGNKTTIRITRDESKILEFSVQEDSFIRFNLTAWDDPSGIPELNTLGTSNAFIFQDSKKLECYDKISPLHTERVDSTDFNYYYMPAGNYKGIIRNSDETHDGVIEINSKFIARTNITIPYNTLTYPDIYPSTLTTIEFMPDEYYSKLKEPQWFGINITEPGQLYFNTTILSSDNLAEIPTSVNPSYVLLYNDTAEEYIDYTAEAINPDESFASLESTNDYLYMAYSSKWHGMEFNFTDGGSGGFIDLQILRPSGWSSKSHTDNTNELQNNGSIIITFTSWWDDWITGVNDEFDMNGINEEDFYWVRLDVTNPYSTIANISLIKLANITIHGNLNFALIKDSGYEYCDFWEPTAPFSFMGDVRINQEPGYNYSSIYAPFLSTTSPFIVGIEPGYYKLLINPAGWRHPGTLNVQFGIADFKGWSVERTYNITKTPLVYPYNITNGIVTPPIAYNYSTYPFELSTTFNNTLVDWGSSFLFVECYGEAYQWTQLVIGTYNVSQYDIWIMQDLPWINNNGPNYEIRQINSLGSLTGNNTIEFGVLSDTFTLIFGFNESLTNETITFNIDLSQYNTTLLTASSPVASYTPPTDDSGPWILVLAIGIPVIAGIIVVVYILKRKGRILTKHP